jgi:ABC-type hemin transport system substrate-binding protein
MGEAMENVEITAASVESVQAKLQALYEELPDHEKPVLETLLAHAAEGGRVSAGGSGEEQSIIIVGGRPARMHIPLNPEVLVGLNPQPIPPGRAHRVERHD